ncbi:MAG: serine/threonine protein kinase, partial [Myxococcales bacterium]|nr:serine/threonine protein kinase [Myxococcales bacterium]
MPSTSNRYDLISELGRGGMSVVYLAHDHKLDRTVALKTLQADDRPQLRQRLLREAKLMARINHPNVVRVYDVDERRAIVVMEYVEGQTLRRWLESGPRPRAQILAMFRDAGRGLVGAHARGVIHRDFKPDNVMVDRTGRARVMDFG